MKPRKDLGFDEESDKAGEEDEDESDGEETGEKSFFRENFANSNLQGLPHAQSKSSCSGRTRSANGSRSNSSRRYHHGRL